MAITFSILAVILGYSTSKYFPDKVPLFSELSLSRLVKKVTSAVCYSIALVLFIMEFGSGTGTLVWLFTVTLILSISILGLPYKSKLIYLFLGCGIFFLILDIIKYAS